MSKGGGNNLFIIGCGLAFVFAIVVIVAIIIGFSLFEDFDIEGMGDATVKLNVELLTDEGRKYLEGNKKKIEETIQPSISGATFLYSSDESTYLAFMIAAILGQPVETNDKESCDNYWIGPMKFKELNWSSKLFLNDFPDAKTQFSESCGDIKDERQEQLKDIERLAKYQHNVKYTRIADDCEEQAKKARKELYCRSYGADANQDKVADPFDEKDAIAASAHLLRGYEGIYGNFGQALNMAYGDNEKFLRAIKNQIVTWFKDPSSYGILRWPLDTGTAENKVITKRYSETNGEVDLIIQSKDGEKVYAAGVGQVVDVGSDPSCGEYVKLIHNVNHYGNNISAIYCNLKEISVKKGEEIQIGKEIGTVKEKSLTIRMSVSNRDENNDESQTSINPEEYLTAPNDITFKEETDSSKEETNNSSESEEKK